MLSIYSFKRKRALTWAKIFACLAVVMMAQPAHAQSIAAIRRAVVSDGYGSRYFTIDTSGRMRGASESKLEITRLGDDGAFSGKYYAGKLAPSTTNVTGTISVVRRTTNVYGISFTVSQVGTPFPSETVFQGAIRLGASRETWFGFMAGTFTNAVSGGVTDGSGPFPFCAQLTVVPG